VKHQVDTVVPTVGNVFYIFLQSGTPLGGSGIQMRYRLTTRILARQLGARACRRS